MPTLDTTPSKTKSTDLEIFYKTFDDIPKKITIKINYQERNCHHLFTGNVDPTLPNRYGTGLDNPGAREYQTDIAAFEYVDEFEKTNIILKCIDDKKYIFVEN